SILVAPSFPLLKPKDPSALVFAGPVVTAEAGSTVSLPCNLTGPSLSWRWIPRYPVCAGVSGGIQTIYTAMAGGAHDAPEGRFQKRLRLLTSQGTRTSVLEVQTLHMSDSGTFFCASPRQNTTPISVTITPGNSTAGGQGAGTPGFSPQLWEGFRILVGGYRPSQGEAGSSQQGAGH
uniref:Ig-like domain-containing protein n=1 Tax=Chrysemys picta bellii TaxID=8478 RepID=A0A8C3HHZ6_CHRPI